MNSAAPRENVVVYHLKMPRALAERLNALAFSEGGTPGDMAREMMVQGFAVTDRRERRTRKDKGGGDLPWVFKAVLKKPGFELSFGGPESKMMSLSEKLFQDLESRAKKEAVHRDVLALDMILQGVASTNKKTMAEKLELGKKARKAASAPLGRTRRRVCP